MKDRLQNSRNLNYLQAKKKLLTLWILAGKFILYDSVYSRSPHNPRKDALKPPPTYSKVN